MSLRRISIIPLTTSCQPAQTVVSALYKKNNNCDINNGEMARNHLLSFVISRGDICAKLKSHPLWDVLVVLIYFSDCFP